MKRITWALIIAVLFMSVPYAVQGNSETNIQKITFEEIETIMMERNPTIQTNDNVMENLINNKNSIADAEDDKEELEDAIDGIDDTISVLNQVITRQEELISGLEAALNIGVGDPVIYAALTETIQYLKGVYEGNIATLRKNRSAMRDQLDQMELLPNQELEIDKAIMQVEMGNKGIVWGAQNLYLGYNTVKRQRDELAENLDLLEDQIQIMEIQQGMGMVTSLDVTAVKNQREQMILGLETLDNQIYNLKGELNLMLGQDFDTELVIEDIPDLDVDKILQMDYEEDLETARKMSCSIRLQSYNYEIEDNNVEWADDYGNSDDRRAAERDFENAAVNFEQEHKNVDLAFHKIYQAVKDKFNALEVENRNLDYQQQKYGALNAKYDLGMVSKMEWKQGKAEYDAQLNKVEAARQDLLQVWTQYEWFLDGMDFQ